jgi:hypothetical protein
MSGHATRAACYHAAVTHLLLGMLAIVAVALVSPTDDIQPITIGSEHYVVAWTVELQDRETACRAKAWIGRMGEQPIFTLFAVELDDPAGSWGGDTRWRADRRYSLLGDSDSSAR